MNQLPDEKLCMQVQFTIIDNLGLKMYATLPPVISELIANSWDADATKVTVTIPKGEIGPDSEIEIKDNGLGMELTELNQTYLRIGRNRRQDKGEVSNKFQRKVMGRKGIGKLSSFGVAQQVEVTTVKNGIKTVFTLDHEAIKNTEPGKDYQPVHTAELSLEPNGTSVKLKKLSRKNKISLSTIRTKLARRFACIDNNFRVSVNGVEISVDERNLKEKCEYTWDIDEVINEEMGYEVEGWIGTLPEQVPTEIGAGVAIMARNKLVQEPTHFDVPSTGWNNIANGYIVGEIHADFLDEKEDLIVTNRCSVIWDSDEGRDLKAWGQRKLKEIAADWGSKRREKKEKVVLEDPKFSGWFKALAPSEKKVAKKVVHAITSGGELSDDRVKELAGFMKESFHYQVFNSLVDEIEETPTESNTKLIELFHEWSLIEAKEVYRVAQGRLAAIEKLETLIRTNAREVPDLHDFLAKYPWILDPSWTISHSEAYYSKLLKEEFPNEELEEDNLRIDFVCIGAGDTLHVVELKRPKIKINIKALEQLEKYMAFIQQRLGNSPNGRSYNNAAGYIIGEDISTNYQVPHKVQTLERSRMYVRKYADLLSMAKRLHKDFEDRMKA